MVSPVPPAGRPKPWGQTTGLLAACLVTLIGFVRGLGPDVILLRAFVAALLLGVLVSVASMIVNRS